MIQIEFINKGTDVKYFNIFRLIGLITILTGSQDSVSFDWRSWLPYTSLRNQLSLYTPKEKSIKNEEASLKEKIREQRILYEELTHQFRQPREIIYSMKQDQERKDRITKAINETSERIKELKAEQNRLIDSLKQLQQDEFNTANRYFDLQLSEMPTWQKQQYRIVGPGDDL